MNRRRVHPMTALVCWLAAAVVVLLCALVIVSAELARRDVTDVHLDRAHLAGMEFGHSMCLGTRAELERQAARPAALPQRRSGGGLL